MKKRKIVSGIAIMVVGVGLVITTPRVQAKAGLNKVAAGAGVVKTKYMIEGTVVLVYKDGHKNYLITVEEKDGVRYEIFLGPKWYQDAVVKLGDKIEVEGVMHNGKIIAWKLTKADGKVVTMRNASGKPGWMGKNKPIVRSLKRDHRSRLGK